MNSWFLSKFRRRLRLVRSVLLLLASLFSDWQFVFGDEAAVTAQLTRSSERFATSEAWAARREQLRTEFLKGAKHWPLPARPPVRAIQHSLREYSGYSVENVALETLPGFYCTGNLYRPLGRKDLSPASRSR